ncbi:hypothetical protein HPB50_019025 [Hyalomma asiaticum]|uniref:Uncharacterized protein n=1 Tax=Hyalomma asiaticum TaxID=266040 RepID=A0ACB7T5U2_HYAAI|nr:hypothetical protein HPB50_019025 [Hyalomma asiaticum]
MPVRLFRRTPRSRSGTGGDPGARMQARARELEDELSRFCADGQPHHGECPELHNVQGIRARQPVLRHAGGRGHGVGRGPGAAGAVGGSATGGRRPAETGVGGGADPGRRHLGGLVAAPPAVGPAPAGFPAGPGVQVARGAGPAVTSVPTYAAVVRAGVPAGVPGAGPFGPAGLVGAAAPGTVSGVRHEHAAFLTPVGATERRRGTWSGCSRRISTQWQRTFGTSRFGTQVWRHGFHEQRTDNHEHEKRHQ